MVQVTDVGAELEQLRLSLKRVSVVAFVDLTANMVLRSSARSKMQQEELDAICSEARAAFSSPALEMADGGPAEIEDCVIVSDGTISVFLRARKMPGDALIIKCDRNADLESALSNGRAALEKISTE